MSLISSSSSSSSFFFFFFDFNAIHNVPESGHNRTGVACTSTVPTHSNTVLTSSCLVKIKLSWQTFGFYFSWAYNQSTNKIKHLSSPSNFKWILIHYWAVEKHCLCYSFLPRTCYTHITLWNQLEYITILCNYIIWSHVGKRRYIRMSYIEPRGHRTNRVVTRTILAQFWAHNFCTRESYTG